MRDTSVKHVEDHHPSSFSGQAALVKLEAEVLETIHNYAQCNISDTARSRKLEAAVQANLAELRALTRDLELLVEEVDSDEERQHLARLLSTHIAEYHRIQQAFRSAAVARHQNTAQKVAAARRELLGAANGLSRRRQLASEADALAASEGITESLRRTRQVMAEELTHTSATLAAMDASHVQLSKTRDQYFDQHSILKRSKGLLRTLQWQNRSETLLLWFGLALFALAATYVAYKRSMYFVPEALRPMSVLRSGARLVSTSTEPRMMADKAANARGVVGDDAHVPPPGMVKEKQGNGAKKATDTVDTDVKSVRTNMLESGEEENAGREPVAKLNAVPGKQAARHGRGANRRQTDGGKSDGSQRRKESLPAHDLADL